MTHVCILSHLVVSSPPLAITMNTPTANMRRVNEARRITRAKVAMRKAVKAVYLNTTYPPSPSYLLPEGCPVDKNSVEYMEATTKANLIVAAHKAAFEAGVAFLATHNTGEDHVNFAKTLAPAHVYAPNLARYGY